MGLRAARTLLMSTDELEPRYGRLQAILKRLSIRSICALPLRTAHPQTGHHFSVASRSMPTRQTRSGRVPSGGLHCASVRRRVYFAALRGASEELQSRNDRLRCSSTSRIRLSQIWSSAISLRAISHDVRRVMKCDYAACPSGCGKQAAATLPRFDFPEGKGFSRKSWSIRSRGRLPVRPFRTMKPLAPPE